MVLNEHRKIVHTRTRFQADAQIESVHRVAVQTAEKDSESSFHVSHFVARKEVPPEWPENAPVRALADCVCIL